MGLYMTYSARVSTVTCETADKLTLRRMTGNGAQNNGLVLSEHCAGVPAGSLDCLCTAKACARRE